MPDHQSDAVTRADLNQQLEVHAKTIELQILLSKQQEEIVEKLDKCIELAKETKENVEILDKRTWKQEWLFWGIIFSLISTSGVVMLSIMGN
jgi:beta-galactosidase beta subunit